VRHRSVESLHVSDMSSVARVYGKQRTEKKRTYNLLVQIPVSGEFLALRAAEFALGRFNGFVEVVLISGAGVVVVHDSGLGGGRSLECLLLYCGWFVDRVEWLGKGVVVEE
jgi:hypothetical protein